MAEKEYVLGNKTKDLLVYSFLVTKPIGDKTMEISEIVKLLETVLGLSQEEKDDFIRECLDKMKKASSKQGFPKSALHTYIKTIRETAVSIVQNIHAANDCSFQTEYERRLDLMFGYVRLKRVLDAWGKTFLAVIRSSSELRRYSSSLAAMSLNDCATSPNSRLSPKSSL